MKKARRPFKALLSGTTACLLLASGGWILKDRVFAAQEAPMRPPIVSPTAAPNLSEPNAATQNASLANRAASRASTAPAPVPPAALPTHAPTASPSSASASSGSDVLLINAWHPLPEGFIAEDLVNPYDLERSFQLASADIRLNREVFEAADRMFAQAHAQGVDGFILTSGYRTQKKQRELYEKDEDGTAAKPGESEHQSGLAFDVTAYRFGGGFEDTEQFRWLSENCWSFGFILRYPEDGAQITGIPYEPWHYRYVGTEIARAIYENGWTLEEYCDREGT